jgi:hypothetical protein
VLTVLFAPASMRLTWPVSHIHTLLAQSRPSNRLESQVLTGCLTIAGIFCEVDRAMQLCVLDDDAFALKRSRAPNACRSGRMRRRC